MNSFRIFSKQWSLLLGALSVALIAAGLWNLLKKRFPISSVVCFAYRDINRNGSYDIEDRPYAGLRVTMKGSKGRPIKIESNLSGFANFKMAKGNWKSQIHSPGQYTFHIEPPYDWEITSGNSTQAITIKAHGEASAGIIAERLIEPVGVAPRLRISGSVDKSLLLFSTNILRATSPAAEVSMVSISTNGHFSIPATAGHWHLELITDGKTVARGLSVKGYPVIVSQIGPGQASPRPRAELKTIGFDQLTLSDTLCEVPNGYEGLNWRNWVSVHQKFYQCNGYINVAVSSEYVAYASAGDPATFSSAVPFDFVGAYVGTAWPEGERFDVVVKGWRQDRQIYEDRFRVSASGPIYFDADYRSVTRVEFSSQGYWNIIVDDVTCRFGTPTVE